MGIRWTNKISKKKKFKSWTNKFGLTKQLKLGHKRQTQKKDTGQGWKLGHEGQIMDNVGKGRIREEKRRNREDIYLRS
jgi:hypothetical protein